MAILFFDDFRGYAAGDLNQVWSVVNGSWSITLSGGRNNGPYAVMPNGGILTKTVPSGSSFVFGAALYVAAIGATRLFHLIDSAGTIQCSLRLNSDLTLEVLSGTSTAVTSGKSTNSIATATWYYIEWKITIANSIGAGTCVVRVNGVDWITVATGQDLQAAATAAAGAIVITNPTSSQARIADVYVTNDTTFLGDCTVDTLYVNGNGTTQDFDPSSGSDHSLLVDETSGNGDTDYVSTTVATERELFTMSNLAVTPSTIHAVSVWNSVRKDDAGVKKYESTLRSGGTNYDATEKAATDTYLYDTPIWETDPATASAWSESGVNAIEAGIQVTL